jgi:hypothetical protein
MTKHSEYIKKVDWISTEDLLSEMSKRFDHYMFIGVKPEDGEPEGRCSWKIKGSSIMCKGLLSELEDIMAEEPDVQKAEDEEST